MNRRHFPRWLSTPLLASTLALSACLGGAADPDVDDEGEDPTEAAIEGLRAARDFNIPRQGHNDQCVRPRRGLASIPLRFADFSPTGFTLATADLQHNENSVCPDGTLQLDAREILATPQGRLYFHRGGYGYERAGNVKYGHVWIGDLESSPPVRDSVGNGAPCPASTAPGTRGSYRIAVRGIPPEMNYWKTNRTGTISYVGYGDPGYDQGNLPQRYHYAYLVWSWVNVTGGGVVRSLLQPGQVFHRCDVRSIRLDSVDDSGAVNGWVQAVYGKTLQGGNWLYGWTVFAHQRRGDAAPTYHMEPM